MIFFPTLQLATGGQMPVFNALVSYLLLVLWGGFYPALAQHRKMEAAISNSNNLEKITRESEFAR